MLTRRFFMTAVPLMVLSACSREEEPATTAQRRIIVPQPRARQPRPEIFSNMVPLRFDSTALGHANEHLGANAPDRQFWFFLDSDHSIQENQGYMALDSTMQMLAARGTKHLFIERPLMFQGIADKYAAGEISERTFKACVEVMADNGWTVLDLEKNLDSDIIARMIKQGQAHGMKVHFADLKPEIFRIDDLPRLRALGGEMVDGWLKYLEQNPAHFDIERYPERQFAFYEKILMPVVREHRDMVNPRTVEFMTNSQSPAATQSLEYLRDIVIPERMAADRAVAAHIRQTAGNDPAAAQFGEAHYTLENGGIDFHLGGPAKVFAVGLWATPRQRDAAQTPEIIAMREKVGLGAQKPDANLFFVPQTMLEMPRQRPVVFNANGIVAAAPEGAQPNFN